MKKTIIARHRVGNFYTWLNGHQDRVRVFSPAVSSFKTFRDADDSNSIVVVFEVTDMEKFETILNDPSIDALKAKHTVIAPITVSIQVAI